MVKNIQVLTLIGIGAFLYFSALWLYIKTKVIDLINTGKIEEKYKDRSMFFGLPLYFRTGPYEWALVWGDYYKKFPEIKWVVIQLRVLLPLCILIGILYIISLY